MASGRSGALSVEALSLLITHQFGLWRAVDRRSAMIIIRRGDGAAGIWAIHYMIRDLTQMANRCISITTGGVVFPTLYESAPIVARL
jgi:hypothetical protein